MVTINPTIYITRRQIERLVMIDELGKTYDEWVEMLERHGWIVLDK